MEKLDVQKIRADFPMFRANAGKPWHYLDTASSSQTPTQVLEAADNFYFNFRANVHRGMYKASATATERYEAVRRKVADLIRGREGEIIFTRGTTESLNLAANSLAKRLGPGDEVVTTVMEHHANLVPWQQMAKERGFTLKFIPIKPDFSLDMDAAKEMIGPKTKIVAVTYASNVLGTVVPVADLARLAHAVGATVVVDAAQAMGHLPVHVDKLGADLLAFSGHKMLGPTGAGVLWGKKALLETMEPYQFGGDMIREVRFEDSTWNEVPWKFEAGTPNVSGVIGLGAAVDYVKLTGVDKMAAHEERLTRYAMEKLAKIPGLAIVGPAADAPPLRAGSRPSSEKGQSGGTPRVGVISFVVEGIHPHDMATILDAEGVCVRGGHHCAMPLLRSLGHLNGTTRASFSLYNDEADADALVAGIEKAKRIFRA